MHGNGDGMWNATIIKFHNKYTKVESKVCAPVNNGACLIPKNQHVAQCAQEEASLAKASDDVPSALVLFIGKACSL